MTFILRSDGERQKQLDFDNYEVVLLAIDHGLLVTLLQVVHGFVLLVENVRFSQMAALSNVFVCQGVRRNINLCAVQTESCTTTTVNCTGLLAKQEKR